MNRLALLAVALVFCSAAAVGAAPSKPNIVFILADDLGWSDLGCYGADLHETPNLDAFARQAVRFPQAYAMSVCSPTRASILTGKHAARLHITIWREGSLDPPRPNWKLLPPVTEHDLPLAEMTTAEALKAAGYLTFHVGKWHLGDAAHYPETQGFDVNIGGTHWGAPNTYFYPFSGSKTFRDFRYVPGLGVGKKGDYLTDRLTDEALKLIDSAADRPFFLNLCYHSPHTPIEGKAAAVEHFRQKLAPGLHHQNPDYAAMVQSLDENVGRVLRRLDERHLADTTLVVFTSDNGGFVDRFGGKAVTNNAPLRSGKGSLYEGGVRIPMMIRWPGVTPAGGGVCDVPTFCTDFFPTIASAAGVNADSAQDGLSLLPLLKDPTAGKLERDALFFHYPHYYSTTTPVSAIRQADWKLLEYFEDQHVELYNLKDDPGETKDLAIQQPDQAAKLRQRLADWRKAVGAQVPTSR